MKNNAEHIQKMRDAALIASTVIAQTAVEVKAGVTLNKLDEIAAKWIDQLKAMPFNLNYKPEGHDTGFPAVLCTSVNNEIAHGIPDDYVLKNGDIVKLDVGILFNGVAGDCAITVPVGPVENKHERLIRYANRACYAGIEAVKPGIDVTEISKAVERFAMQNGYVTCQVLSGHGIGEQMHEDPTVPFFTDTKPEFYEHFKYELKEGDVICIEPMLTFKDKGGFVDPKDGWTVLTRDGRFSAMFEHMVLVTKDGYEVLTDHFVKM